MTNIVTNQNESLIQLLTQAPNDQEAFALILTRLSVIEAFFTGTTAYFPANGTIPASGNWNFANYQINHLGAPSVATDAATKGYVDSVFGTAQPADGDLTALAASSGTGISVRTGASTWALRNIVAGSSAVTVTNPDGVAGNISIDLTPGNITSVGVLTSGTWHAGLIGVGYGGTGTNNVPSSGQILVGTNTGIYTPTSLSAINGLSVNAASGSLTLSLDATSNAYSLNSLSSGLVAVTLAGTVTGRQLIAGSTKVTITNANGVSGNPTLDVNESNLDVSNMTGTLGITHGGTGATSALAAFNALSPLTTAGDLLYSNGASAARLGIGTNSYLLTSTGTAPQWSNPTGITVGTATNLAGGATGSIVYQSGSGASAFLALGTTNYVLTAGASAPQWVAQSTLSVGSATTAGSATSAGVATNLSGGAAGSIYYQVAPDTTSILAIGSSGYVLTSTGSAPQWVAQSTLGVGSATTAGSSTTATTATNLAGGATGSLPYQASSGTTSLLALGTTNYVLTAGASAPQWVAQSTLGVGTATTATNLAGGAIYQLPYQTGVGATGFVSSVNNAVLVTNGSGAPSLVTTLPSGLTIPSLYRSTASGVSAAGTNQATAFQITADTNIVSTVDLGQGVVLPTATAGRTILLVNNGGNPLSVYPVVGEYIDSLGINTALVVPVGGWIEFDSIAGHWYSSYQLVSAGSGTATNIAAGSAGAILYQTATGLTGFSSVAGSANMVLVSGVSGIGQPQWVAQSSLASGSATTATTATNLSGGAIGSVPYQSGVGTTSLLTLGTSTYLLTAGVSAPQWTNPSSVTVGNASAASTASNLTNGSMGAVPYQTAPGATSFLSLGTTNYVLTAGASAPQWVDPSSMSVGTASLAVNMSGGSTGSLSYQTGSDVSSFLALGTSSYVLTAGASAPQWTAQSSITAGSANNLSAGGTNQIPYQTGSGSTSFVSANNNSVLVTDAGGAPSLSTTLPSGLTIPGALSTISTGLTSSGSNQGTALALTSDVNVVSTVGVNTGVILPVVITPGNTILVVNAGANALRIYPAVGSYIDGLSINASVSIPAGGNIQLTSSSTSQWYSTYQIATAGSSSTANLFGGLVGDLPFQAAPNTTSFLSLSGALGYFLTAGASAPQWTNPTSLTIGNATLAANATNVVGGATGSLLYQTNTDTTGSLALGTTDYVLTAGASAPQWVAQSTLTVGAATTAGSATTATTATNLAGGSTGSIVYQSGAGASSTLALGSLDYVLTAGASAPQWVAQSTLGVGNSSLATNLAAGSANQIPYQNGASSTVFTSALANAVLVTSGSSVPSLSNTLPSGLIIPMALRLNASSVSAAGTNQTSATILAADVNTLTSVGSGQGVMLPNSLGGTVIRIINKGGNTVNIYPAVGSSIDSLGTNNPITLVNNGWIEFDAVTPTQWYSTANLSVAGVSAANNINGGTTGALVYQSGASATSFLTLGTTNYVLTAGASAPQWVNQSTLTAGTATTATNIASGVAGSLPYQSGAGTTSMLGIGGASSILTSTGSAPQWTANSSVTVGAATTATHIAGGATGSLPYQVGGSTTGLLALGTSGYYLTAGASAPQWSAGSSLSVGTATNVAGGATNQIPYQTGAGATGFVSSVNNAVLVTNGVGAPSLSTTLPSGLSIPGLLTSSATSISAAGSNQATATPLTSDLNVVTTVAASTGVALPAGGSGKSIFVINKGANTLNVYPANGSGASIDALAANAPITLTANGWIELRSISTSQWYSTYNLAIAGVSSANNIAGGATGSIPFQTGAGATSMLALGTTNYVLTAGASAPQWVAQSTLGVGTATSATTATNIAGGVAGSLPYQTGVGATSTLSIGGANAILTSTGSAPQWTANTGVTVGNATLAVSSTNLAGGVANQIAYQTGVGATTFMSTLANAVLITDGSSVPSLSNTLPSGLNIPAFNRSVATGITASGSTQGTATAITADINTVTTVAASTGVVLPTATAGRTITIVNRGANTLSVYPATGASIDGLVSNAALSIPANGWVEVDASSSTQWYSSYQLSIAGVSSANNLSSGATGSLPYQSGVGATTFLALGTTNYVLTAGASAPQWVNQSTLSVGSATTSTNISAGGANQIPYQTGAGATSFLAANANAVLVTNGSSVPSLATTLPSGLTIPGGLLSTSAAVSAAGSTQATATALTSDLNIVTTVAASTGVALPAGALGKTVIVINRGANALSVYPANGSSATIDSLAANAPIVIPVNSWIEFNSVSTTVWYSSSQSVTNNLASGAVGSLPYQSGVGATSMLALGTTNYVLTAGASAPQWVAQSTLSAGTATTATNLASGAAGSLPYQSGTGATSMLGIGTSTYLLTSTGAAPQWSNPTGVTVGTATVATNVAGGAANQIPYQTGSSTTSFTSASANSVLVTNGSSVPSLATTLPSGLTVPSMYRSVSSSVSAAGSTQGTATALTSDTNIVTTVAASTGVVLPTASSGRKILVVNKGANALNVYPATGGAIDALSTNVALVVPVSGWIEFDAVSTTQWYSSYQITIAGGSSANNLTGGAIGSLPYQSGSGATTFLALGTTNYVLTAGASAPQWVAQSTLGVGTSTTATNVAGGAANQIPYQTGIGATSFVSALANAVLVTNGSNVPSLSTTLPSGLTIPGALTSTTTGIAAAGSTQGTATALTSDTNIVSTVSSGQGVVLPTAAAGRKIVVVNRGANALSVYPATGAAIDGIATNLPITLPVNGWIEFEGSSATQWYSSAQAIVGNLAGGGVGSLPYQSGSGVSTFLSLGTTNYVLTAGASAPQWVAQSTLSVGTTSNLAGGAANQIVYQTGSGATSFLNTANNGLLVTNGSGVPSISATLPSGLAIPGALNTTTNSISAAGSTQGTATALTSDVNVVTTVGSGQGVVLQTSVGGKTVIVINRGANALRVYPASGATIDALGTNAAISLPVNSWIEFNGITSTQWYSSAQSVTNNLAGGTIGALIYQSGVGATTALTLGTTNYVLTAGASAPQWVAQSTLSAGTATTATNVSGGAAGSIVYQSGAATTTTLALGTTNYVLTAGASAPQWVAQSTLGVGTATTATTATNVAGGATGSLPYQSGVGTTSLLALGTTNYVLTAGASAPQWVAQSTLGVGTATSATTATNIASGTANQLVYQTGAGATGFITAAANSVLVTNGSNVPSLATTLPSGLTIPGSLSSVSSAVTTSSSVQGGVALTSDLNIVTTVTSLGNGVTLQTASAGKTVTVINRGANALAIWPATGAAIDGLSANTSVTIPVGGSVAFRGSSATQWYSNLQESATNLNISGAAAGAIVYQTGANTTTALTLGTTNFVLTAGASAPQWVNQSTLSVGTASNLAGGGAGSIVYQSSAGASTSLALGTTNYVLTAGASAPQWVAQSTLGVGTATTATNLAGGATGGLHYQSGAGASTFLALGTTNYVLTAGASAPQWVAQSTLTVGAATTATNVTGGGVGSLVYQSGAATTTTLALGTTNYVLSAGASAPQWVAQSTLGVGAATNIAGGAANQIPYQTGVGTTSFASASANSVLVTNGSNVPSLATTLPSGLTVPSMYRSVNSSVAAAGSTQGTATALTSDTNIITTSTVGSAFGVALPTAASGRKVLVVNRSANTISVYPATGASIDGISVNTAISVTANTWMEFDAVSTTKWYSSYQAATSSAGGVTLTNDVASTATFYPIFVSAVGSGALASSAKTSGTNLTFVPSSGTFGATVLSSLSDVRLKTNIQSITDASEKLSLLNGVYFDFIHTGLPSLGFLAQEVKQILPQLVSTDTETGMMSVSYAPMVALLVEGWKSEKAKSEALANKVSDLETRLAKLEALVAKLGGV